MRQVDWKRILLLYFPSTSGLFHSVHSTGGAARTTLAPSQVHVLPLPSAFHADLLARMHTEMARRSDAALPFGNN